MKRTLLIAGAIALVAPLAALLLRLHRPLPLVRGTIEIAGPSAAIDVLRDAYGIPHIRAANRADAIFGLGFVHAQDRLWQMDLQRRAAAGRLSEVLGPGALDTDRFMRTIGFARAARHARASLEAQGDTETLDWLDAYVRGINAFLSRTSGWRLPIEYTLTGSTPEPWTIDDVFATMKLIAWGQGMNWREDLMRLRLSAKAGAERAAELLPGDFDGATILAHAAPSVSPSNAAGLASIARLLDRIAPPSAAASNAWAIGGSRTTTGRPILANDPHIPSQAPATWYLAHVTGGDLDVIGATFPGVGAVVIGHNGQVAWGITNAMGDAQDLFVVRSTDRVETREEIIKVKGEDDVRLQVRTSPHGPIVSDLVDERGLLALAWTGLDAADTTVTAFLRANVAADADAMRAALSAIHAPMLSIVYATEDGTIGYAASGRLPIRDASTGLWTGRDAAAAFAISPPDDVIVSANNAVGGTSPQMSTSFDLSYRADRIAAMIAAEGAVSLDDAAAMQQDVQSLQVHALAPLLFDRAEPRDARAHAALQHLKMWDGGMRADSPQAALFKRYYLEAARALFRDDLGKALYGDYEAAGAGLARALHRLARTGAADAWCDDVELPGVQTCGEMLGGALDRAIDALEQDQGSAMAAWRWDRDNRVRFAHVPMDAVALLRPFFSRELGRAGDGFTVNPVMRIRDAALIASYRQVIDVGDWDQSRFVMPLGQSGHPMSGHYDDLLPLWHGGRFVPMAYSEGAVRAAAWHTLTLRPQAPASSADIPRDK